MSTRTLSHPTGPVTGDPNPAGLCGCGCGGSTQIIWGGRDHGKHRLFMQGHHNGKRRGGPGGGNLIHGMSKTPTYATYRAMIERCTQPHRHDYQYYGARGIKICARWLEPGASGVLNFHADMGDRPEGMTIDRIDNDGHYSCGHCAECVANGWPANCRWATAKEQGANQRPHRKRGQRKKP